MQAPGVPCGRAIHFLFRVPYWTQDSYQPPYLLPRYVGQVGEVDQLLGEFMRVVVGADDDVRAGADIGRHRGLGPHVLPALLVDTHFDAGHFGEFLRLLLPFVPVALNELAPAQNAQLGALFGLDLEACLGAGGTGGKGGRCPLPPRSPSRRRCLSTRLFWSDQTSILSLKAAFR